MADISKINPNGTEYNLKDATARSAIENTNENIQSSITVPKASVVTVPDAAPINAEDITVDITPIQDLHGYDRPWAGGAGKNKLPMTVAGIKAANTGGTWSGNSYTTNGVTFTINTDDAENVISISSNNGGDGSLKLIFTLPAGSYILSSGFTETMYSNDTYLRIGTTVIARGTSGAFTLSESTELNWNFRVSHTAVVCTPMIRLATETDSTFAPYSNICPIEGRTGAELTQKDDATNPTVTHTYTASFGETVYGGKWHVTAGGTDKTHANIASYNGETINEPWLSSLDEYVAGATPTTGAQVVYPLTTPTTISTPKQNVPMLQGINTVYANCGDVSLKYQPDNVVGELKGEIEDNIIYEDYKWTTESSQSYSAGTPGTYGTSCWRDVKKEGYDVIGVTFVGNRRFGDCILTLYYVPSTSHVEVIIFRATSSSVTIADEDIVYRVAYKKH